MLKKSLVLLLAMMGIILFYYEAYEVLAEVPNQVQLLAIDELEEAKQHVKEQLETYAAKPISDAVAEIINEQVDKITTDNYQDTNVIETIIDEGKDRIQMVNLSEDIGKALAELKIVYDALIESGDYATEDLAELKTIYDQAVRAIGESTNGEDANIKKEQAITDFDHVEKINRDTTNGWIITALLAAIFIEIMIIVFKRKSNMKRLKLIILPVLFFTLPNDLDFILIVALTFFAIVLLGYIIYLFVTKGNGIKDDEVVPMFSENISEIKMEPASDEPKETSLYIRYNYSFAARLHQAPTESQERFSTIKNFLLKHQDISVRQSWRYERFMHRNTPVVKAWIHGNIIDLYMNIDPKTIDRAKYAVEDVGDRAMHATTPTLFKVVGTRTLLHAIELLSEILKEKEVLKHYVEVDYTVPFIGKEKLLEMGLIKINR